jgi:hypothetical protein
MRRIPNLLFNWRGTGDIAVDKTSEDIDQKRRSFANLTALSLAAATFGLARAASAESKPPSEPPVRAGGHFPGFSTEFIKTSVTTIHVLRKGTGRPLLLLHGYPETHLT